MVGLVLLMRDDGQRARPRPPQYLGESDAAVLCPKGEVEQFERFEWTWTAAAGESIRLTLWPHADLEAEPIVVPDLRASSWNPDETERAALGDAIRFRITHLRGEGVLDQAYGSAWLRSSSR